MKEIEEAFKKNFEKSSVEIMEEYTNMKIRRN